MHPHPETGPGQAGRRPPGRNRGKHAGREASNGARARFRDHHATPEQQAAVGELGARTGPEVCKAVANRDRVSRPAAPRARQPARNAATKTLLVVFQMFAYDCWQIQRALHRKLRRVPKAWRVGPTLERFRGRIEDQVRVGACAI